MGQKQRKHQLDPGHGNPTDMEVKSLEDLVPDIEGTLAKMDAATKVHRERVQRRKHRERYNRCGGCG